MRVEWYDVSGYYYCIDTEKPALLSEWLVERIAHYTAGYSLAMPPPRLTITPNADYDARAWPHHLAVRVEQLQWLVDGFRLLGEGKAPVCGTVPFEAHDSSVHYKESPE